MRQRLSQAGVELFEEEREITITREFSAAASRIRLNGAPVTREAALALRPSLLDLHGQHDLTTLFDPDSQRQSLDALGDPTFQALKRQTAQAVADWRERQAALDQALARQVDAQSRREAAQDDLALLVSAQLEAPDEDARLRQSVQRLGQGENSCNCAPARSPP